MKRFMRGVAVAVVAGALAIAGPATSASARSRADADTGAVEYVGVVKGVKPYVKGVPQKEAYFLAVVVHSSGQVIAYTCDGFGEAATFEGTENNGTFSGQDGDASIDATIRAARATGTLTLEGHDYDFDLKPAKGVGGLYTVSFSVAADGTATGEGTSERGNEFAAVQKRGQKRPTFTFTLVDGTKKKVTPTPLRPPKRLLGLDGYRAVFLDNGRMGRGNPLQSAATINAPSTISAATIRVITSTTIQFY